MMRASVVVFPGSNCDRDIATALEKIWNAPEMAREMGKRGRERVEKLFSWEKVSKDIEAIFTS